MLILHWASVGGGVVGAVGAVGVVGVVVATPTTPTPICVLIIVMVSLMIFSSRWLDFLFPNNCNIFICDFHLSGKEI